MCQCGLHLVLCSHIAILMRLLATEPHSIAGLLFPLPCLFGMILVTLCSMVWDWSVSIAGSMLFIGLAAFLLLYLLLFSLSVTFYGLVLWGCGLRTDRVLIALSQHCRQIGAGFPHCSGHTLININKFSPLPMIPGGTCIPQI